jgi:hypothetical protein
MNMLVEGTLVHYVSMAHDSISQDSYVELFSLLFSKVALSSKYLYTSVQIFQLRPILLSTVVSFLASFLLLHSFLQGRPLTIDPSQNFFLSILFSSEGHHPRSPSASFSPSTLSDPLHGDEICVSMSPLETARVCVPGSFHHFRPALLRRVLAFEAHKIPGFVYVPFAIHVDVIRVLTWLEVEH